MSPELQNRVDELFDAALSLEAGQRAAFLDQACGDSATIRGEVDSLLAHYEQVEAAGFLKPPPATPEGDESTDPGGGRDAEPPPSLPGYDILCELGRGGMGVVYKARQRSLNRVVAVKMIRTFGQAPVEERGRFRVETEAAARLQHPNLVPIYEVGEHAGRPYCVLEYVDGGTLAQRLKQVGTLPPRPAAELIRTLARAVQHAHDRGIVHRDLKPANVLLTADGVPKIADFGLAKRLDDDPCLTHLREVMGTPSYMAPEQAEGKTHEVGKPCDIYALGGLLYEVLTGRPPFQGTSVLNTLEQVRTQEPVPPRRRRPGLPRDLETICLRCLQKDPTRRYPNAEAVAADLGHFLAGEPIVARPVCRAERLWRWCRRKPAVAALAASLTLLVMAAAVGGTYLRGYYREQHAAGLVDRLLTCEVGDLPRVVRELKDYPSARDRLEEALREETGPERQKVRLRLALLPFDSDQAGPLLQALLQKVWPEAASVLCDALVPNGPQLLDPLREILNPHAGQAPRDPPWRAPDPKTREAIVAAMGLFADHFAFCQTMDVKEFEAVAEDMEACQFRLLQLRPYARGKKIQVAAVWTRDGVAGRRAFDGSVAEMEHLDGEWAKEDFVLLDVARYPDLDKPGADLFAAVWVKEEKGFVAKWHPSEIPPGPDFAAWTCQSWLDDGGKRRSSFVSRKTSPLRNTLVDFDLDGAGLAATDHGAYFAVDIAVFGSAKFPPRCTVVWHADWAERALDPAKVVFPPGPKPVPPGEFHRNGKKHLIEGAVWKDFDPKRPWVILQPDPSPESEVVHGLDPARHRKRCQDLEVRGYQPVAISVAALGGELATGSVWHRPKVSDETIDARATAAVLLVRLGREEEVWPLLKHSPDPRLRTSLIHRFRALGVDRQALIDRLYTEEDVGVRQALVLSLGEFEAEAGLLNWLRLTHENDKDAGLHSATGWLLRHWGHWGQEKPRGLKDDFGWCVTKQGHLLAVVRPGEIRMGSPRGESHRDKGEVQHFRAIPRPFLIGAGQVTRKQFSEFDPGSVSVRPVTLTWDKVPAYCNWLSGKEGIDEKQWCYEVIGEGRWKAKEGYLGLAGYRLPTEAEWECACRADSLTSRFYGTEDSLLGEYAVLDERVPGAQRKPNGLGLFDLYSRTGEWCQDAFANYEAREPWLAVADRGGPPADGKARRVIRGFGRDKPEETLRSAARFPGGPTATAGFRVARTILAGGKD